MTPGNAISVNCPTRILTPPNAETLHDSLAGLERTIADNSYCEASTDENDKLEMASKVGTALLREKTFCKRKI